MVQAREQREQLQEQLRQLRQLLQDDGEAGSPEAALAAARDADVGASVDRRKAAITVDTLEEEVRIPPSPHTSPLALL